MNSRRLFLKEGALATTALIATKPLTTLAKCSDSFSFSAGSGNSITILHTGDIRSNISPVFNNRINGLGGVNALSEMITSVKKEKQNVLLLDAGNLSAGNNDLRYQQTLQLVKAMNYDAVLPGHLDFAAGEQNLYSQFQESKVAVVISNYEVAPLNNQLLPYRIIKKGNIKVGIIGAGVNLNQFGNSSVQYINPLKAINRYAAMLKNDMGCNVVVCLSHLGYKNKKGIDDIKLAKSSEYIDVIAGAHSKTFLKAPVIVPNKNQHEVIVNHTGFGGIVLGTIDMEFDESGNKKMVSFRNIMVGAPKYKWIKEVA